MKIRNLILVVIGIAIGYRVATKMHQDEPDVVRGPQSAQSSASPSLQLVSTQAQRLADQASVRSLEAIRRARGAIRSRLGESEDDAAWN
jgi:hypothetical protein